MNSEIIFNKLKKCLVPMHFFIFSYRLLISIATTENTTLRPESTTVTSNAVECKVCFIH